MGHELIDAFGHGFAHKVAARTDIEGRISISLKRTTDCTGIAMADAKVDDNLARREHFGGDVEIEQMGVGILYGAAYARGTEVGSVAGYRELRTLIVVRKESLFRMDGYIEAPGL